MLKKHGAAHLGLASYYRASLAKKDLLQRKEGRI
jgi:hypothetical protein